MQGRISSAVVVVRRFLRDSAFKCSTGYDVLQNFGKLRFQTRSEQLSRPTKYMEYGRFP